jgi:tetratricopeptide (TPR) repeat protein
LAEAEHAIRRALAVAEKGGGRELALAYAGVGRLLWETGKLAESQQHFQRARELWERMMAISPKSVESRLELALLLADWPDPQLRVPDRAVSLAREAVDQSPHLVAARDALGVALYRAGAAKDATGPLMRSVEMSSGGEVNTWFFLAMALGLAGDKDRARLWYDKATDWTATKRPKDPELLRLRAEAAALLGLTGAPASAARETTPSKRDR